MEQFGSSNHPPLISHIGSAFFIVAFGPVGLFSSEQAP
jgi:hypothetical protein